MISKNIVAQCINLITMCLNEMSHYNIEKQYQEFINMGQHYIFYLNTYKHIRGNLLFDINDWFCGWCFGLEIGNLTFSDLMPSFSQEILNFTTNVCFSLGEEREKIYYIKGE